MGGLNNSDVITLKVETPYFDHMVKTIVFENYETLLNLREYSVEDFLALFEIVYIKKINSVIASESARRKMGK